MKEDRFSKKILICRYSFEQSSVTTSSVRKFCFKTEKTIQQPLKTPMEKLQVPRQYAVVIATQTVPIGKNKAYRPPRSKCTLCSSVPGVEYPILTCLGTLPPRTGVPPGRDLGPVTGVPPPPEKGHGTSGSIMGWRWTDL